VEKLGVPEVLVDIIRSFPDDMEARISLNQSLLEEIMVFIRDVRWHLLCLTCMHVQ